MTIAQTDKPTPRKPLRLWPGVVAVVLQWLARFGIKAVVPGFKGFALAAQGGLTGAVAIVVWWAFLSRAAWSERLGAIPILCLAFVAWAVASRRLAGGPRRATMVATVVLACGAWTLVRTEGISGDHVATFAWRWTKSPEEKLMAQAGVAQAAPPPAPAAVGTPKERLKARATDEPTELPPAPASKKPGADWSGFRGPQRDGIIRGVRIDTNWSASPPVELWRRPVGPGWSSFAVRGNFAYTQEQRGDNEVVACYDLTTGQPVWTRRDAARFFESNGGAGPRGTPSLSDGRAYTFGAT